MFDIDTEGKTDKEIALEGIDKLSAFWTSLGAPSALRIMTSVKTSLS